MKAAPAAPPFQVVLGTALGATQSIADQTDTNASFATNAGDFDVSSGTALETPSAGYWLTTAQVTWVSSGSPGYVRLQIRRGATVLAEDLRDINGAISSNDKVTQSVTYAYQNTFEPDELKVTLWQETGASLDVDSVSFRAMKIGQSS